jgi:cell division protein FtsB
MLNSKTLAVCLLGLCVLLQWPVWVHHGGWTAANNQKQLKLAIQVENQQKEARNAQLKADVNGLEDGNAALEERARFVLGMVSKDERFVLFTSP